MVGRSKSDTKKIQDRREVKDALMAQAVALYLEELKQPVREKRKGLRTVCKEIEQAHLKEKGNYVKLDQTTLSRLAAGGKTKSQSNASKGWLLESEVDVVINFIIECASRGFPLSHRRLREHVNSILHARLGGNFPDKGIGKRWTHRFVEKHSKRLHMYWSHGLDNKRGRAVNPITNDAWYKILGETLQGEKDEGDGPKDKKPILPKNTCAADESGFWGAGGVRERVIGPAGKSVQHRQEDGSRENTTVIVTICADGTSIPPAVIFKGQAFQVKWDQNNPANALYVAYPLGWSYINNWTGWDTLRKVGLTERSGLRGSSSLMKKQKKRPMGIGVYCLLMVTTPITPTAS